MDWEKIVSPVIGPKPQKFNSIFYLVRQSFRLPIVLEWDGFSKRREKNYADQGARFIFNRYRSSIWFAMLQKLT